eukprot:186148-Amorphochlora_amoeboformis.AAC.1
MDDSDRGRRYFSFSYQRIEDSWSSGKTHAILRRGPGSNPGESTREANGAVCSAVLSFKD